MPKFDIAAALADGYSYSEIASYLSELHGFDLNAAKYDGIGDEEVAGFLSAREVRPPVESNSDFGAGVKQLGRLAYDFPTQVQGAAGALMYDPLEPEGTGARWMEAADARNKERAAQLQLEGTAEKQFLPGISVGNVQDASSSAGFSAVAMGPSVVGEIGATLAAKTPNPAVKLGGQALSYLGGAAGSAGFGYKMDEAMFTKQLLDRANQQMLAAEGRPMNEAEIQKYLDETADIRSQHGLWEAGPEAVGNALEVIGLRKIFSGMAKGNLLGAVAGLVMNQATEHSTETITGMGQQPLEVAGGLREENPYEMGSPQDWATAFKEQAPVTAVLGGVTGGAAGISGRAYRAVQPPLQAAPEPERQLPDFETDRQRVEGVQVPTPIIPPLKPSDFAGISAVPDALSAMRTQPTVTAKADTATQQVENATTPKGYGNPLDTAGEIITAVRGADEAKLAELEKAIEAPELDDFAAAIRGDIADRREELAKRQEILPADPLTELLSTISTADQPTLLQVADGLPGLVEGSPELAPYQRQLSDAITARQRILWEESNVGRGKVSSDQGGVAAVQPEQPTVGRDTEPVGEDSGQLGEGEGSAGVEQASPLLTAARQHVAETGDTTMGGLMKALDVDIDTAEALLEQVKATTPLPRNIGGTQAATVGADTGGFLTDQAIRKTGATSPATTAGDAQGFLADQGIRKATGTATAATGADTEGFVRDQQIRRDAMARGPKPTRAADEPARAFLARKREWEANNTSSQHNDELPTQAPNINPLEKPWMLRKEEYHRAIQSRFGMGVDALQSVGSAFGGERVGAPTKAVSYRQVNYEQHARKVAQAIRSGEDVPASVLAEYPGYFEKYSRRKPHSPERGQEAAKSGQVDQAHTTPKTTSTSDLPGVGTETAPSSGEASNIKATAGGEDGETLRRGEEGTADYGTTTNGAGGQKNAARGGAAGPGRAADVDQPQREQWELTAAEWEKAHARDRRLEREAIEKVDRLKRQPRPKSVSANLRYLEKISAAEKVLREASENADRWGGEAVRKEVVRRAYESGKPVPSGILAEFPDIASNAKSQQSADMADVPETDFGEKSEAKSRLKFTDKTDKESAEYKNAEHIKATIKGDRAGAVRFVEQMTGKNIHDIGNTTEREVAELLTIVANRGIDSDAQHIVFGHGFGRGPSWSFMGGKGKVQDYVDANIPAGEKAWCVTCDDDNKRNFAGAEGRELISAAQPSASKATPEKPLLDEFTEGHLKKWVEDKIIPEDQGRYLAGIKAYLADHKEVVDRGHSWSKIRDLAEQWNYIKQPPTTPQQDRTPEKPAGVATSGQRQELAKLLTKAQFNDEAQQYANFGKYSDAVASDESPSGIALRQDIRAAIEAYRDDFREKARQVENKLRKWFDIPEGDIKDEIDKAVIALLNGESAAGGGHLHINGGKLFTGRGTRAEQSAKKIANANGTSVVFGYTDNAVAGAEVDDGDFIIELPFDMSDYGKGDGRRIPFLLSSNFRLSGDWAYTPKQPWATRGKPPLIGEYSDFMSKQERAAKEPWQMTREEYSADALERNEYRDKYKANPELLPPFEENTEREWRRSVEKAAETARIPDTVLDSYLDRYGKQVFSSTFRGVAEKGVQGYLYPDVRAEQEPALAEKKKAVYDLKPYERTWAQQRGEERKAMSRDLTRSEWAELREQHKEAVQKAIWAGLPVPANVLAEYPELADAKTRKDADRAAEPAQAEAASGEPAVEVGEEIVAIEEPPKEETAKQEERRLEQLDNADEDMLIAPDRERFAANRLIKTKYKYDTSRGLIPSKADFPSIDDSIKRTVALMKKFVATVPEFRQAPVFTVVEGTENGTVLRFTDSYTYDFRPQVFGLSPQELKAGDRVRLDIDAWTGKAGAQGPKFVNVKLLGADGQVKYDGTTWTIDTVVVAGPPPGGLEIDKRESFENATNGLLNFFSKAEPLSSGPHRQVEFGRKILVEIGGKYFSRDQLNFVVTNTAKDAATTFLVADENMVAVAKEGEIVAVLAGYRDEGEERTPAGSWTAKSTNKNPAITIPLEGAYARKVSAQSPSEKDAETASSEAGESDVSPKPPNKQTALASHLTTIKRMRDGEATVAEYRESFERVIAEKEEIIEELSDLTKAQIFERFVALAYRYKNEKKAEIVRAAYSDMVMQYNLSDSFSYMLGQKVEDVMGQKVEAVTQADLDAYAEERKAARQANKEEAKRTAEALQGNIETQEEYRLYLRGKMSEGLSLAAARRTLPVEVRAKFDDMEATETRERRKSMKDADRGRVTSAAVTTSGEVIETTHTKTGEPLFVVKAAERVERDVYNEWNRTAKRMGGWYSSYRAGGAVPGFQFKTKESADAFSAYLAGETGPVKDIIDERRSAYEDNKEQSTVERLRSMADSLEERADERLSADRLTNTTRRARMAASAEAAAEADKAMAATMRNIAAAIESGAARFLDRVRTKAQVEMLLGKISAAKNDALRERYPNDYSKVEEHKNDKPTAETADFVEFPRYRAFRSDLASIARQLAEKDGSKRTGESLLKVADDVTAAYLKFAKENLHKVSRYQRSNGDMAIFASKAAAEAAIKRSGYKGQAVVLPFKRGQNIIIMSPQAAHEAGLWQGDDDKLITLTDDFGREVLDKAKAAKVSVPWMFDVAKDQQTRLKSMGIETPAELRAAVREFIDAMEVAKQNKVRELELAMSGRRAKDGLDFFPTPESIARDMVDTAGIEEGMSVLEPSAGMGHIAEVIRETGVDPDVVELSGDRRELLEAKGFRVVGNDFMEMSPRGFTFGDTYKAPDGTVGVMRGAGGMGSDRVRLVVDGDERTFTYHDRDELVQVKKNGGNSGYDRIVMNPPFSDRRDVEHVQHAYELLKPGGRLVAIMGEGSFFGSDKKAVAFREWLESVGGTSEKLPEGSFNDKSLPVTTGVNTRMVVIDKPGQSAREPVETEAEATEAPKLSTALPPSSRADIPGELAQAFGKLRARVLMRKITVLESQEDIKALAAKLSPDGMYSEDGTVIQAFAHNGHVYMAADAIEKGHTIPVLKHEFAHIARLGLRGMKPWKALLRSVDERMDEDSATGKALREARKKVPADTDADLITEETLAYAIEDSPEVGLVRRAIAMIKRFLVNMGVSSNIFTVEDWSALAAATLRGQARVAMGEGVRQSVRDLFKPVDTESAAFKRWFGKSVVTDADGKPLVVYHSSYANIEQFKKTKGAHFGFHFGDQEAANTRVEDTADGRVDVEERKRQQARSEEKFKEYAKYRDYLTSNDSEIPTEELAAVLESDGDLSALFDKYKYTPTGSEQAKLDELKSAYERSVPKIFPVGTGGNVGLYYLHAKKLLRLNDVGNWGSPSKIRAALPWVSDARTLGDIEAEINRRGYDGVVYANKVESRVLNTDSYIVFRPEQIKSALSNTGAFSPSEPRIRYSKQFDDGEVEAAMQVKSALKKNDLKWWERVFKTFDYLSRIDPAAKRIFQYGAEDRRENKVRLEDRILDNIAVPDGAYIDPQYSEKKEAGFVSFLTNLQKKDKATYTAANDYLLTVDRTGKAFSVKRQEGYTVKSPDGEVLATGLRTKEDGYTVIRDHHAANYGKDSDVLKKDYSNDKQSSWVVTNPKGAILSEHDTETEAVAARRDAEAGKMRADGKDEKTIAAVMKFREMTDRAFDLMAGDLRRVIDEAERLGLDEPTMEVVDERKRYVILDAQGNKVPESYYENREDAELFAKSISHKGRFQVKKQADNEILMPMTLSAAISQMGDLRGSYFPRQRQTGAVVLTATKEGSNIRKNFDLYMLGGERTDIETGEVLTESKIKTFLRDRANRVTPLGLEMARLKADGYTVKVAPADRMPETVFEATQLFASINALIEDAAKGVKKDADPNLQRAYNELAKTMTMNIADTFKQRGYLSSRMKRTQDYWEGFETDMLKAGVQYAKGMAGGLAKREAAQKMTLALTGRETTFAEYQDQNPGAKWEDYQQFVRDNAIDPKTQPRLLEETKSWMQEMLRNDEQADRILGTIKGLAVLKFLGFRVSSAAVNMTNMVQAVPATIAAQTGTSISRALGQVGSSARLYKQYRTGKAEQADKEIFTEISERGWDNPQFNHEAAAVLRSKAGNWFAKFTDAAMWMFGQAEKVNRAVTIHAAYMQAKRMSPGLGHVGWMNKAKQISDDAHGVYGKETAPAWTRGAYNPLKLSYTFQRFMHNYFLNMGQMWERGKYKELTWMLISPALIAGPGATLLTPIAASMLGALGIGGDDPEEEFYTWAEQTFGEGSTGARVARHGFSGALGVNLKGSIEMGFAMPTTVAELFGAPGSLVTDAVDSVRAFGKGEVSKGFEKALPTGMGTMLKANREQREGITTGGYSPIWYGDEPLKTTGGGSVARFFGFNPSVISGVREKLWSEKRIEQKYASERKRINDRIRRLVLQNGGRIPREDMDEIRGEVARYNERARGLSIPGVPLIKTSTIRQAIRSAKRPPRKERLRTNPNI